MAGGINKLSAMSVQRTKESGYYGDGGGLYLQITKSGGKSWVFRFVSPTLPRSEKTGRAPAREMGLGPVHTVSLVEARDKALACRKLVAEGRDPIEDRKTALLRAQLDAAKAASFADCARSYISAHETGWKNEKHGKQWTATLETYAFPLIGKLPVASVDTGLVMRVLEPIWHSKTETASRLRGRIESILDWATVRGFRQGENPARWKGHLEHQLPARNKVQRVEHHAALPYAELGVFMAALRQREGISARALEFAILTAARSGEIRGATWSEIDLKGQLWTIPAERMKAGKEHRVPLPEPAIALLTALPRLVGNNLVFPATRGKQLSDMSLTAVLKRMERPDLTQHGFRSTFRDWAGETTAYPREVIEHALAHQLKDKAEAAYQRGDLLAKRARLMEDWGSFCATKTGSDGRNA
jgi:integrase